MRQIHITLTALLLVTTFLVLPGCAGTRGAQKNAPQMASLDCNPDPDPLFSQDSAQQHKTLRVKAMAYTSCSVGKKHAKRTVRGAWGDTLSPGIKAVAVSRDLLDMGLDHGDVISIEGLSGQYKVLDVMHGRHNKSIDIFYGDDQCGALSWGKRSLNISWQEN
jgi:3D (Asp-Asp-Asp) domain-containing protein